ncbi:hypothetical protein POM88_042435 [Heracleum sosnowskyi]|uniref:Terpene synthase N-terminal domain-containing protein n=1 Tax=Heracleum sosnowskyi TaxID=360622 RepID=A0AAD8MBM4_9APIA|nr:hypothetical protein POM88_042435 [Heracleum sosnowskyi]
MLILPELKIALFVDSTFSPPNVVPTITQKSASFHPSIVFGETNSYTYSAHSQPLKQEAKKMLVAKDRSHLELIILIDDIHLLGLSYHFEAEIEELLQQIKDNFREIYTDLHHVALCLRLLRQQGHVVSSDTSIYHV